jgi:1-acyl-sn-glycerol-3-phosphate acyltransferase
MSTAKYPSINTAVIKCILWRLSGRKRLFKADALHMCAKIRPNIRYEGLENIEIPRPFVVTTNHYARPGFSTAWIAVSLSAVLPGDVVWIMSNQWLFEGNALAFVLRPLMRFVLKSINDTYSFVAMPTMIGGYSTPQERAAGVREAIRRMRQDPQCILGIAPEGMDSPENGLALPPAGVGRFLLHLQQMGATLLPAAVFEEQGILCVHFGEPYTLELPFGLSSAEVDLFIREEVMRKIAEQMP